MLSGLIDIVLHHHERFDGKGYPDGLKGAEISVGARIIAICDSIDAMTSTRRYRKALGFDICIHKTPPDPSDFTKILRPPRRCLFIIADTCVQLQALRD